MKTNENKSVKTIKNNFNNRVVLTCLRSELFSVEQHLTYYVGLLNIIYILVALSSRTRLTNPQVTAVDYLTFNWFPKETSVRPRCISNYIQLMRPLEYEVLRGNRFMNVRNVFNLLKHDAIYHHGFLK